MQQGAIIVISACHLERLDDLIASHYTAFMNYEVPAEITQLHISIASYHS